MASKALAVGQGLRAHSRVAERPQVLLVVEGLAQVLNAPQRIHCPTGKYKLSGHTNLGKPKAP